MPRRYGMGITILYRRLRGRVVLLLSKSLSARYNFKKMAYLYISTCTTHTCVHTYIMIYYVRYNVYTHWDSKLHGLHTPCVYAWSDSLYIYTYYDVQHSRTVCGGTSLDRRRKKNSILI